MKKFKSILFLAFSINFWMSVADAQFDILEDEHAPVAIKVMPLTDQDLPVLASGAACWLEDPKLEVMLYDDLERAVIKIDSRIVKLNKMQGPWSSGFFACGKNYEYASEDNQTRVSVRMNRSRKSNCAGTVTVRGSFGTLLLKNLRNKCGA